MHSGHTIETNHNSCYDVCGSHTVTTACLLQKKGPTDVSSTMHTPYMDPYFAQTLRNQTVYCWNWLQTAGLLLGDVCF